MDIKGDTGSLDYGSHGGSSAKQHGVCDVCLVLELLGVSAHPPWFLPLCSAGNLEA